MAIALNDFAVPEEDRLTFAKFMAFIAQVDEHVSIEEKHAIDDLFMAWGFDEAQITAVYGIMENGADIDVLAHDFKSPKTPYLLIQELVTLAGIDGHYDDDERKAIRMIASSCGVSEERVESLEQWVNDGLEWRKRGLELVRPEGE